MAQEITAQMILQRLEQLEAKLTPARLYIGARFWQIEKLLTTPIYQNTGFLQALSSPQFDAWLGKLPYQQLNEIFRQQLSEFIRQSQEAQENTNISQQQNLLLETHIPFVDVETGQRHLWSLKENCISKWSHTAITALFRNRQGLLDSRLVMGKVVYDPYKGTKNNWQQHNEGHTITYCNLYKPPIWYDKDLNHEKLKTYPQTYPKAFVWYLNNLIPNNYDLGIVLDWLALAVCARPQAMLVFRGIRGNGKTILKHVIYHLVGDFVELMKEAGGGDFNYEIKNKRIAGADDNSLIGTRKGHDLRKRLSNPTMTFSQKHVQTTQSENMYASFILCSNIGKEFYVEYDERKIVIPLLTQTPMLKWQGNTQAFMDWLNGFEVADSEQLSASHVDFLRQIGVSLFARYVQKQLKPNLELKSGNFWADVLLSLPGFFRFVAEQVFYYQSGDEQRMQYTIVKADYIDAHGRGFVMNWYQLKNWIEGGFNICGEPLALECDDSTQTFIPNPKLKGVRL